MSDKLPKKLKKDAIVEAVFEIRFDVAGSIVPEVFFGRLADRSKWQSFKQRRLPTADIPAAMRRVDPSLRYQPAFELLSPKNDITIRIGPQSLAYIRLEPYPGWEIFGPELLDSIDALFSAISEVNVTRLGLRYINALRSDDHAVPGVEALDLQVCVDDERLTRDLNLNYRVDVSEKTSATVRVATADFVEGGTPPNTTVVVDVDVFTIEPFESRDQGEIKSWIEAAHTAEKKIFFSLLSDETVERLEEK